MRVTEEDNEKIQQVMLWLRSVTNVMIVAKENGSITEKKHIHCLFEHDPKKLSTLRQQFLKKFDCYKGNKSYSLESIKKELENNQRYLCKGEKEGEHNILWSIYTDSEIQKFHNDYWQQNASQNYSKKDKEKTNTSWSQKVKLEFNIIHEQYVNTIIHYHSDYQPSDYLKTQYEEARRQLFNFILKCLGKSAKLLDEQIIRKLYNGIMNQYIQQDAKASETFGNYFFTKVDNQFGLL